MPRKPPKFDPSTQTYLDGLKLKAEDLDASDERRSDRRMLWGDLLSPIYTACVSGLLPDTAGSDAGSPNG
jgi:hypothetical protein